MRCPPQLQAVHGRPGVRAALLAAGGGCPCLRTGRSPAGRLQVLRGHAGEGEELCVSGEELPVPPCLFMKCKRTVRATMSQCSWVVKRGSPRCGPCVLVLSVCHGCCQAVPIPVDLHTQPKVPVGATRGCWSVSNKMCAAGFGGSGIGTCGRCRGRRSFQKRSCHLLGCQRWIVALIWMLGSGSQSLQAPLIIVQERNSHSESGSRQA